MKQVILLVLLVATSASYAIDTAQICVQTSKRLSVLQNVDTTSCNDIVQQAQAVNHAFDVYRQAGKDLAKLNDGFSADLEEELLKPFRTLQQQEQVLVQDAAEKGFLLTPDKRKGEAALAFYPETVFVKKSDEKALKAMRAEQKRILTDILAFIRVEGDYDSASKEFLAKRQQLRLDGLENLETLSKAHREAAAKLQQSIVLGEHIHCFGEDPKSLAAPLQFFEKTRSQLNSAGVHLNNLPDAKATVQFFPERTLPTLRLPEGGHLMLISDEVETLVVAMMEDNLDGAELSIVIEQKQILETIGKTAVSVNQAVAEGLRFLQEDAGFATTDALEEYFENTSKTQIAIDSTIGLAGQALSLVGSTLSGTVVTIWEGVKGAGSFVGRNSASLFIPGVELSRQINKFLERPVRPTSGQFNTKRAYIEGMKTYREDLDKQLVKTQLANQETMKDLQDGVKVAFGLMEAAGVKGTAQMLSATTTFVSNKIVSAIKKVALQKTKRNNFLNKSFATATLESLDDDILNGLSDLTKADQDNIKKILAKRKAQRDVLNNDLNNIDKPPVTEPPKLAENFVVSNDIKAIEKITVGGVDFENLKFGAVGDKGSIKTLLTTNFEDVVGLKLSGTKNLSVADTQATHVAAITKAKADGLEGLSGDALETYINRQLRAREEDAARLVSKVNQHKVRVTESSYIEHDGQVIKVAKRVNKEDTFADILKKSGGEITPQDHAVFKTGMEELNEQGLVWLDPNLNNSAIRQLQNPDIRVLEIFDEDGILKVDRFSSKMPFVIGLSKKTFDLRQVADIKRFQQQILDGGFDGNELTQIKVLFGDPLLPISGGASSPIAGKGNILAVFEAEADAAKKAKLASQPLFDLDDFEGGSSGQPTSFINDTPSQELSALDTKKALELGNANSITDGSNTVFNDLGATSNTVSPITKATAKTDAQKLADDLLNDMFGPQS